MQMCQYANQRRKNIEYIKDFENYKVAICTFAYFLICTFP
jgi:hypothetical protein